MAPPAATPAESQHQKVPGIRRPHRLLDMSDPVGGGDDPSCHFGLDQSSAGFSFSSEHFLGFLGLRLRRCLRWLTTCGSFQIIDLRLKVTDAGFEQPGGLVGAAFRYRFRHRLVGAVPEAIAPRAQPQSSQFCRLAGDPF